MTLSVRVPEPTVAVALHCEGGTVTAVDTAIASGWAKGMPGITSTATAVNQQPGDPLLNQEGAVIGILYSAGPHRPTYLPTQLVLGVADDLRSTGRVVHGWLGVEGATACRGRAARRWRRSWPGAPPPACCIPATSWWPWARCHLAPWPISGPGCT